MSKLTDNSCFNHSAYNCKQSYKEQNRRPFNFTYYMINILFSGTEKSHLGDCLETELKRLIVEKYPQYETDPEKDIMLSFCIQGCFHAYLNNQKNDLDTLIHVSETIVRKLAPLYIEERREHE